jgi:hypothetical protein
MVINQFLVSRHVPESYFFVFVFYFIYLFIYFFLCFVQGMNISSQIGFQVTPNSDGSSVFTWTWFDIIVAEDDTDSVVMHFCPPKQAAETAKTIVIIIVSVISAAIALAAAWGGWLVYKRWKASRDDEYAGMVPLTDLDEDDNDDERHPQSLSDNDDELSIS